MAIVRKPDEPGDRSPDSWKQLAKGELSVWRAIFGDGPGLMLVCGEYEMLVAGEELAKVYAVVGDLLTMREAGGDG